MSEHNFPKSMRSVAAEIVNAVRDGLIQRLSLGKGEMVHDWLTDNVESILRNEWRSIVAECAVEDKELLREILTPKETTNAG